MEKHADIYTQKVINLLIRRRKELGLTQIELANRAGLPQSTIERLETHQLHIRLDTLMKIITVLNLDLAFLNNERLETKRLFLRKLTIDDAQAMFDGWCNDPEVTKYLTWTPHKNVEETKNILSLWIENYDNPETIKYGICIKGSEELIGSIDVVKYRDGNPEIGYCLSRKHWNKGYMSETLNRLTDYLFNIGFNKIIIEADVDNIGSNRVIEKCGFKFVCQETLDQFSLIKPKPVTVNWYEKNNK